MIIWKKLTQLKWLFANDSIMYMAMSGDADVTSFQQNLDRFAASEEKWMMKLHLQMQCATSYTSKYSNLHNIIIMATH